MESGQFDKRMSELVTRRKIDWDNPLTIEQVKEGIEKLVDVQVIISKHLLFVEEYDPDVLPGEIKIPLKKRIIGLIEILEELKGNSRSIIELYESLENIEHVPARKLN